MLETTVDSEVLTEAVRLACRAPSLHNSQPWRWVAAWRPTGFVPGPDPRRARRPVRA